MFIFFSFFFFGKYRFGDVVMDHEAVKVFLFDDFILKNY